ncbi:argininosuccinate lyase [Sinorhizobium meliloti]|uniref:argininosuccinate lyase n=1 Tax=Rhizobium meliloti TaxID=382 RepID=UPI0004104FF8|nr:argininosuccinate lyase [Sinorhizobium meliloti]ARS71044.1 argininosuccinate lyase [Sinorhizobium meliloti RU11/001]
MRERLTSDPNAVIMKHIIKPAIHGNIEHDFREMSRVNRAHAIMLGESGILPSDQVGELLAGLERLESRGSQALDMRAEREDLYFNIEHALIQDVGSEIGGRLHTARSRNDLKAAVFRMKARAYSLKMSHALLEVAAALVEKARAEVETVMTGYTHGQPGQPITAGHYLSAVSGALIRDTARLVEGYERINVNPLGACAMATTTYPINRTRTAELLGFDGLIENSIDAVASRDYVPELIFAFSLAGTTISRLCADLHVWYMPEFNYISIDDSIAGTSSIMPQKKNPSAIEHLKAKSSHLYGALMASLSAQQGVFYTSSKEVNQESTGGLVEAVKQFEAIAELACVVVKGLTFNRERLLNMVDSNYSTLTELADFYVTEFGLSFRSAHTIAGIVAREAHSKKLRGTSELSAEMVNSIAVSVRNDTPKLSEGDLRKALDAKGSVERRKVPGGPSVESVIKMVGDQEGQMQKLRSILDHRETKLAEADERLTKAASMFLKGESV